MQISTVILNLIIKNYKSILNLKRDDKGAKLKKTSWNKSG